MTRPEIPLRIPSQVRFREAGRKSFYTPAIFCAKYNPKGCSDISLHSLAAGKNVFDTKWLQKLVYCCIVYCHLKNHLSRENLTTDVTCIQAEFVLAKDSNAFVFFSPSPSFRSCEFFGNTLTSARIEREQFDLAEAVRSRTFGWLTVPSLSQLRKILNYKTAFPNGASVNLGQGKRNDSIAFSSASAKQWDRKENY